MVRYLLPLSGEGTSMPKHNAAWKERNLKGMERYEWEERERNNVQKETGYAKVNVKASSCAQSGEVLSQF